MKLHIDTTPAITSNNIESGKFGMELSAKTFKIFTSSIYKYKIRAIIRELYSNAIDGLIARKRQHGALIDGKTIDVHLPTSIEPTFIIRDYGTGMSKEFMFSTYTTYFASTKNDNNDEIGGLGLGCKSPLCLVSTFTVTSIVDGIKNVYSVYMTDSGEPNIASMGEFETDELDGVEVRVPVQPEDFAEYEQESLRLLPFFSYQPNFIGQNKLDYDPIVFDDSKTLYNIATKYTGINVGAVMGGVVYPIPDELTKSSIVRVLGPKNCFIEFDIGQLDFQPSREELSLDKTTIANITSKLEVIDSEYVKLYERVLEKSKSLRNFYKLLKIEFQEKYSEQRNISFSSLWSWTHARLCATNPKIASWGDKVYRDCVSRIKPIAITTRSMDVRLISMNRDRSFHERKIRRYRYSWVPVAPDTLTKIESNFKCVVVNDLKTSQKHNRTKVLRGLQNLGVCELSSESVIYIHDEYSRNGVLDDLVSNYDECDDFKVVMLSEWYDRAIQAEKEFVAEQKRIAKEERLKRGVPERDPYTGLRCYLKNSIVSGFIEIKKLSSDVEDMTGFYVEKSRYTELQLLSQIHPDLKNAKVWVLPKPFMKRAEKNENLTYLPDEKLTEMLEYAANYHVQNARYDLPIQSWERDLIKCDRVFDELSIPYIVRIKKLNDEIKQRSGSVTTSHEWNLLIKYSDVSNETIRKTYNHLDVMRKEQTEYIESSRDEFIQKYPLAVYVLKSKYISNLDDNEISNIKSIINN
ncbi:HSP90 family molecular chaperone [Vibrio phage vB_VmeM-32]|nr:HSP90 family molecular chaperone [Vibrio phage vB_VmeM-32]